MTKEEVLAAYGELRCKFTSYYKYLFCFQGTAEDGAIVSLSIGGGSDDIYRYSMGPETCEALNRGEWSWASVKKDGKEVWSEYRY